MTSIPDDAWCGSVAARRDRLSERHPILVESCRTAKPATNCSSIASASTISTIKATTRGLVAHGCWGGLASGEEAKISWS